MPVPFHIALQRVGGLVPGEERIGVPCDGPAAFSSLQLTLPDSRVMLPTGTDVLFGAGQGDDKGNQRKNPDHNQQDGEGQPATWRLLFIKIAAEVTVSKRRILIQLSRSWPYLHYFQRVCQRLLSGASHARQPCARTGSARPPYRRPITRPLYRSLRRSYPRRQQGLAQQTHRLDAPCAGPVVVGCVLQGPHQRPSVV